MDSTVCTHDMDIIYLYLLQVQEGSNLQIIDAQSTDTTGYHHFAPSSHNFGPNIVFIEAPALREATDNAMQTYVIQEDGFESTTVEIIHSLPAFESSSTSTSSSLAKPSNINVATLQSEK